MRYYQNPQAGDQHRTSLTTFIFIAIMIINKYVAPFASLNQNPESIEIKPEHIIFVSFTAIYPIKGWGDKPSCQIVFDMNNDSTFREVSVYAYESPYINVTILSGGTIKFKISTADYNSLISMAEDHLQKSISEISYGTLSYI